MFYERITKMAKRLIALRGTDMLVESIPAGFSATGKIIYIKPDKKREDTTLSIGNITTAVQRRAYFYLSDNTDMEIERGYRITSNARSMTIEKLEPIAPNDILIVYECLLEV